MFIKVLILQISIPSFTYICVCVSICIVCVDCFLILFSDIGMERDLHLMQTHYHVFQAFYNLVLKDIRIDSTHKRLSL